MPRNNLRKHHARKIIKQLLNKLQSCYNLEKIEMMIYLIDLNTNLGLFYGI